MIKKKRLLHYRVASFFMFAYLEYFDQMYANNVKDWYVEVEQYTNNDPVASVQQSYDFLNKADYVK